MARLRRRRRRFRRVRRVFTFAAVASAVFAWRERNLRANDSAVDRDNSVDSL